MNAAQIAIMREIATNVPAFSYWTEAALNAVCDDPSRLQNSIICDASGFVVELTMFAPYDWPLPVGVGNLTTLKSFTSQYDYEFNTLPSSWSSLTELETLIILPSTGKTRLAGGLPESWSSMTKLKTVHVEFADPLFFERGQYAIPSSPPSWIGNVENLTLTYIDWSPATFPAAFSTSTKLKSLKLDKIHLSGSIPTSFTSNTLLTSVYITTYNAVAALASSFGQGTSLPSNWAGMTSLNYLYLGASKFSGSLPSAYPSTLQTLSFDSMPTVSGTIPSAIFNSASLQVVSLNQLPGLRGGVSAPSNPSSSNMSILSITGIGLDGSISAGIFSWPTLRSLNIANSPLSGSIPAPVVTAGSSSQCNLWVISIERAYGLRGALPLDNILTRCRSLTRIAISGTGNNGQLPALTDLSPEFTTIQLANMPLGGTIPTVSFSPDTTSASVVQWFNCSLTGTIPSSLLQNKYINYLDLSSNRLSLCANSDQVQPIVANRSSDMYFLSSCKLVGQTPRECGCPTTWPTRCFSDRAMAPDCGNLPPDTLPVAFVPPSSPSGSGSSSPTNSAVRVHYALLLVATIIFNVIFF